MNLINIKRLAYAVREAQDAFETPIAASAVAAGGGPIDRRTVAAAVDRYLAARGVFTDTSVTSSTVSNVATEVVDRFLSRRSAGEKTGFS